MDCNGEKGNDPLKNNESSPRNNPNLNETTSSNASNASNHNEGMLQENLVIERDVTRRLQAYERKRMSTIRQIAEMNAKVAKQEKEMVNLQKKISEVNARKAELKRRRFSEPTLLSKLENMRHVRDMFVERFEYFCSRNVDPSEPIMKELEGNVEKLEGILMELEKNDKNKDLLQEFVRVKNVQERNDQRLANMREDYRNELEKFATVMEFYSKKFDTLKTEKAQMSVEEQELEKQFEEFEMRNECFEKYKLDVEKKKQDLLTKIKECGIDINEMQKKKQANVKWQKKQVKEKIYKIRKLKNQVDEIKKSNDYLEAVNGKLLGEIKMLSQKIEECHSELDNKVEELEKLSEMKKQLEQKLVIEENSLAECEQIKLQEVIEQQKELEAENERLEYMKYYAGEIETLRDQFKKAQLDLHAEMEKNHAICNSIVKDLSAMNERKSKMKSEMEQLACENKQMEESLRAKKLFQVEQEKQMKKEIEQLEGIKSQVSADLGKAIQENSEVRELLEEADLQKSVTIEMLDRLKKENRELEECLCLKGEQMEKAETVVQDLEEKMRDMAFIPPKLKKQNRKLFKKRQYWLQVFKRSIERKEVLRNMLRQIDDDCELGRAKLNEAIAERKGLVKKVEDGQKHLDALEKRLNWVRNVASKTGQ